MSGARVNGGRPGRVVAAVGAVTVLVAALLTALGVGSASAATCHPYPDVTSANSACGNITWLKGQHITKPADGLYHPTSSVTRGSMTAFLFRLTNPGKAQPACTRKPFPDVDTSGTFCGYIAWAKSHHIAFGYSDGTYRPGNDVTRGAMAAYLFRIANPGQGAKKCTSKPFSDVQTGDTFCGVITWMVANKITYGIGGGKYGTTALVTRQAMASFLHRIYTLMHRGGSGPHNPPTTTPPPPTTTPGGPTVTRVNQTVTINGMIYSGVRIEITLVQIVDPVTSPDYVPDPGNKFVGLKFRITNVGTSDYQDFAPFSDLVVTDSEHQQHDGSGEVAPINAGSVLPSLDVGIGDTVVGYLVVEIPAHDTISKVDYTLDFGMGQTAYWTF